MRAAGVRAALAAGLALALAACSGAGEDVAGEPDARAGGLVCVDTESDPENCGACGRTCVIANAEAGCEAGECVIAACELGFSDDDGEVGNGCEAGGAACGVETCNAADDDCDGACDEGALAGCRSGVHRANGNGHYYTTDLAAAQTAPYSVEAQDYFFTYVAPAPGLAEAFLCRKGDGRHFVTPSATCENAGTVVRSLGFWATEPSCGAVPLYRLYNGAQGNHFYTTSAAERDNAVSNLGYVFEFVAGYVWPAP